MSRDLEKNVINTKLPVAEEDTFEMYPLKSEKKNNKNDEELIDQDQVEDERSKICKCFHEYSENTSIHGIQYLGEENRPILERLFWIICFGISIYTCSHMIYQLWRKWNDTPVIVSFDERETEIWKIPFPAVTVCPQVKSNSSIFNLEQAMNITFDNLTQTEKIYTRALLNLCQLDPFHEEGSFVNETERYDVIGILKELSPDLDVKFTIKDEIQETSLILTEEGFCYNFNGVDLYTYQNALSDLSNTGMVTDWNRENGYRKGSGVHDVYPRRVLGSGIKVGLDITIFSMKADLDNLCSIPPDGYKVIIHAPDNIPMVSSKFFNLPAYQHVIAAVKPNMMWASDELKSYSAEKRQCFFNDERKLKYFTIYTQLNCNAECITDFAYSKCGCVRFYMPRFRSMRICQTFDDIECCKNAEDEFLSTETEVETHYTSKENVVKRAKKRCNCLAPCTTFFYNIETSQSEYDHEKVGKALSKDEAPEAGIASTIPSKLTVFFKESSFLTSKRTELYGISEFVANCGGLLGLFMGFSALSFVEIFYFSIIRTFTNCIRNKRNNRNNGMEKL